MIKLDEKLNKFTLNSKVFFLVIFIFIGLIGFFAIKGFITIFDNKSAGASGVIRYVNDRPGSNCEGKSPCYSSIQGAIDAVGSGETIRIQYGDDGVYPGGNQVSDKNDSDSTEDDRIIIEPDPEDPRSGSIKIDITLSSERWGFSIIHSYFITLKGISITSRGLGNNKIGVNLNRSYYVTLKKLTIYDVRGGSGISLGGAGSHSEKVLIEGNKIFNNVAASGISGGRNNRDILIINNLVYGNNGHGMSFNNDISGGWYYIVNNTIYLNDERGITIASGRKTIAANNIILKNGSYGVNRQSTSSGAHPDRVTLWNNLICGNIGGEIHNDEEILDNFDKNNISPTGNEGADVDDFIASKNCNKEDSVFKDVKGPDNTAFTEDDDFQLRFLGPAFSPATDTGLDPSLKTELLDLLGILGVSQGVYSADFSTEDIRPKDGDGMDKDNDGDPKEFDIGAFESDRFISLKWQEF